MKRLALYTFGLVLLATPSMFAQELPAGRNRVPFDPFLQDVAPAARPPANASPVSGYVTPRQLVFEKAALRAAQRQQRIAMNKAIGYSPLRPPSSAVPAMGSPRRPLVVWVQPVFPILYPASAGH